MTSITKNKNKPSFWQQVKKNKVSYSMVAPFFIIFFTFTVLPVLMSFGLSFTSFDMLQAPKFIGLDNYINLFLNDEVFLIALKTLLSWRSLPGRLLYHGLCFRLAY